MATTATALLQTGPREQEFAEIPIPRIGPGAGLLRIEANGLCASDIDSYHGTDPGDFYRGHPRFPRINGHEIVGVIEELGPDQRHDNLKVGDRVAVNPFIACGECDYCRRDQVSFCSGTQFAGVSANCYGYIPSRFEPALFGGYSTHLYIHPDSVLYPFPPEISALDATLWNPLTAGIQWAVMNPGTTVGSKVAVLGCGQRGLASVVAVKDAGAELVLTSGLAKDRAKLDLALEFGADFAVDVEHDDLVDIADKATGGKGFDIVVDVSSHSFEPIRQGIQILRSGGTLVTAGIKTRAMPDFPIDSVTCKAITIIGSIGSGREAYQRAANLVAEQKFPLSKMRTHVFGFDRLERAIEILAGDDPTEHAINVVVTPTMTSGAE